MFAEHFGDDVEPALLATPPTGGERDGQQGFLLVAEVDGNVVGFAHVTIYDDTAHLEQLSVLPSHGRQGIGRALVREAMEEARWLGFDQMALSTYRDVPWNGPFYRSLGFAEVKKQSPYQQVLHDREIELGLGRHGARVVMAQPLDRPRDQAGRSSATDE